MEGFIQMKIRPWIRRLVTRSIAIIPAIFVILIAGESSATQLLVWSQVILSFQLPFSIVPLIRLTSNEECMSLFKNHTIIVFVGWACVAFVSLLNIWLIFETLMSLLGLFSSILSSSPPFYLL